MVTRLWRGQIELHGWQRILIEDAVAAAEAGRSAPRPVRSEVAELLETCPPRPLPDGREAVREWFRSRREALVVDIVDLDGSGVFASGSPADGVRSRRAWRVAFRRALAGEEVGDLYVEVAGQGAPSSGPGL